MGSGSTGAHDPNEKSEEKCCSHPFKRCVEILPALSKACHLLGLPASSTSIETIAKSRANFLPRHGTLAKRLGLLATWTVSDVLSCVFSVLKSRACSLVRSLFFSREAMQR